MASLLDIGHLTEEVEVRGTPLTVQGWTAGHIFQLFAEFPEMRKLVGNKEGNVQEILLSLAPDLIAKLIAMALGEAHNKAVEEKAKQLGAGDQVNILMAAQKLSFEGGIGPFVEQVNKLMTSTSQISEGPTTPLPNSSNSKTELPAAFSASLQTDGPPSLRGHARRVN